MFDCKKTLLGKHKCYNIYDSKTKTGFSVVPSRGALMLDMTFNGVNVLDAYQSAEELEKLDWMKNTILYPFPNRLQDGRYQWQSIPQQFAINDKGTGNALHGFALFQKFKVTRLLLTDEFAEITCRLDDAGKTEGYPYPSTLEVTFGISINQKFRIEFAITNLHSTHIPVGVGWHPYFKLTENVANTALRMPICDKVEIDARMIPNGKKTNFNAYQTPINVGDAFLDNCFHIKDTGYIYKVGLQGGGKKLSLQASLKSWPFLQMFTPPYRGSIAIEPMTCNIDAFNNEEGLIKLPPGGIWKGSFAISVT
jgi:aldose 1-epimerase